MTEHLTLYDVLETLVWAAARELDHTQPLHVYALAYGAMIAAIIEDTGVRTLSDLEQRLQRRAENAAEDAETAPDDDAARDRMERSKDIDLTYTDPDGTRWEIISPAVVKSQHPEGHDWLDIGRDDDDRERRACRTCGLTMVKAMMQT